MINRYLTLTLATLVLLGTNGVTIAQNPLRLQAHTPIVQTPHSNGSIQTTKTISPPDATPEEIAAINNFGKRRANSASLGQANRPISSQQSPASAQSPAPIVDHNVAPAVHLAKPKNDMAPIIQLLDSLPNNLPDGSSANAQRLRQPAPDRITNPLNAPRLESSLRPETAELETTVESQPTESQVTSKTFDREKFQTLIQKLAINTAIVMCVGIGFILVAKRYYKGKSPRKSNKTELPIQITSTLKLSPKSNLHLIEAGEHRLIVAADQNGIKSMVRLTDSFANTLGSLEDLASELGDEPGEQNLDSETSNAGTYTLATLGQMQAAQATANPGLSGEQNLGNVPIDLAAGTTTGQPVKSPSTPEDKIRSQMEAALREHGLKDLILETLQKD